MFMVLRVMVPNLHERSNFPSRWERPLLAVVDKELVWKLLDALSIYLGEQAPP